MVVFLVLFCVLPSIVVPPAWASRLSNRLLRSYLVLASLDSGAYVLLFWVLSCLALGLRVSKERERDRPTDPPSPSSTSFFFGFDDAPEEVHKTFGGVFS